MNGREIMWAGVDVVQLSQGRKVGCFEAGLKLRIPPNARNFFTGRAFVGPARMTPLTELAPKLVSHI